MRRGKNIRKARVHLLVLEAFHGPKPSSLHRAHHVNGNRHDNRADNLVWAEHIPEPEPSHKTHPNQIDAATVRAIHESCEEAARQGRGALKEIAARHGTSLSTVWNIKHGQAWRHATGADNLLAPRHQPDDLPGERWRPVKGYKGRYAISNLGRLKSTRMLAARDGVSRTSTTRLLRTMTGDGQISNISLHRDGTGRIMTIHKLVLEAFRGPRPSR